MCGIVGYIDQKKAYPILQEGLKRLEYCRYNSAGVALISKEPFFVNAYSHSFSSQHLAFMQKGIIWKPRCSYSKISTPKLFLQKQYRH